MCRVKSKKDVMERLGLIAELDNQGGEQTTGVLLLCVPKIEKEEGYAC
jgi:hypothetical protein